MSRPTGIQAYVSRLADGETVSFRESGNSMVPLIASRSLCTYEPVTRITELFVGDAVFCHVHGAYFTHLIAAIDAARGVYTIANNHGHVNGTTSRAQIFGRVTPVTFQTIQRRRHDKGHQWKLEIYIDQA